MYTRVLQQQRVLQGYRQYPRLGVQRPSVQPVTSRLYQSSSQSQNQQTQQTKPARKLSPTWNFLRKYTWVPVRNSSVVRYAADAISSFMPVAEMSIDTGRIEDNPEFKEMSALFFKITGYNLAEGEWSTSVHIGPGFLRRLINAYGKDNFGIDNLYDTLLQVYESYRAHRFETEQKSKQQQQGEQKYDYGHWQQQSQQQYNDWQQQQNKQQGRTTNQGAGQYQQQQQQRQQQQSSQQQYKPKQNNPYQLLGIRSNASKGEIKKAFLQYMLKNHPDIQKPVLAEQLRKKEITQQKHDELVMQAEEDAKNINTFYAPLRR